MLSIQLDPGTEQRLALLAEKTGRSPISHAQEAIQEHLEDLEDVELATHRLATLGRIYSAEEVKHELGL
ncbi:MAG: TraY domain-containing protein [Verrucomicrobiota bacterium]